jgi:hypothetical protein
VGWLWAQTRGASFEELVFLSDGRVVLKVGSDGVTLESSFAGSVKLERARSLVEIDLDGKRATLYPIPQHTSCLSPTTDGNLLGCYADYVKEGRISWPSRCELVKWDFSTRTDPDLAR